MTDRHRSLDDDPLPEEIEAADALLDQANALLQRHRGAGRIITAVGEDLNSEDLPLLTEVVDDFAPPSPRVTANSEVAGPVAASPNSSPSHREALEVWLDERLPQILAEELEFFTARVRSRLLAALSQHDAAESATSAPDEPTP
ncbi:MAG: hypothetical protein JNJ44_04635 [Zoogloeaceae bacterium]|nr:hypothetical protein [Zoogloeaceae bacterium]